MVIVVVEGVLDTRTTRRFAGECVVDLAMGCLCG